MARSGFTSTVLRSARVGKGTENRLDLVHGREHVPATWLVPASDEPVPAVLLLHGFSSSKERMASSVGRVLLARGIASLALDLPFHGERGSSRGTIPKNPLALVGAWRDAVSEACGAIDWMETQPSVDASRLGVLGYSLGGFLALMLAADEPRLRAIVMAAAGDLPDQTPYAAFVRGVVDPLRAARRLAPRPLLLVNGRFDTTTRPAQAERLFAAARDPKRIEWYEGGHWPPLHAIEQAGDWIAESLGVVQPARRHRGSGGS